MCVMSESVSQEGFPYNAHEEGASICDVISCVCLYNVHNKLGVNSVGMHWRIVKVNCIHCLILHE